MFEQFLAFVAYLPLLAMQVVEYGFIAVVVVVGSYKGYQLLKEIYKDARTWLRVKGF